MIREDRTSRSPLAQANRRRRVGLKRSTLRQRANRSFSLNDETILRQILSKEQDYIPSDEFLREDAERAIFDEAPEIQQPDTTWYHPIMDDLSTGERTRSTKSQLILTAAQERVLFLQFNYARHRISLLQKEIWSAADREPTDEQAAELLRWSRTAMRLREQIANTNLALVLAMAKRTRLSEVDFAEMVSEGNMALLRAVDKFDAERGFKFSTYACRAILKAFSRQGMKQTKHRQRFPTEFDPDLQKSDYVATRRKERILDDAEELKQIFLDNEAELTDIECVVIEHRFGIKQPLMRDRPLTLEQIGKIIGVTKERVRQIQNKALVKLREELEERKAPPQDDAEDESVVSNVDESTITGFSLN
jgi:RNA polymerase primary sigma factor